MTVSMDARPARQFVRTAISLVLAKGRPDDAAIIARSRFRDTAVSDYIQKAASGATGLSGGEPLTVPGASEFLAIVRPRTILGKTARMRRVPFWRGATLATGGGVFAWVTDGRPAPVGNFAFSPASLHIASAGGIVVLTKDLVELYSPTSEDLIREELVSGLVQFLDAAISDPAIAAVAGASPASITNGAPSVASSGSDAAAARSDLITLVATIAAELQTLDGVVIWMSDVNAFALSMLVTPGGSPVFPGLGATGGEIGGVPVVTSSAMGSTIAAVHAPSVLIADEGGVKIDMTEHATVQMDTEPTNNSRTPTPTALVSLWQTDSVGVRLLRTINWGLAREGAVALVTDAEYGPLVS